MLNKLYEILEKKEDFLAIKLADKNHKVFKAHFPSNPLLPGFMLIDICEKEFDLQIKTIKKISFLKSIFPDESISFHKKNKRQNLFIVDVTKDSNVVATISFEVF